jgi:hypothetical protein
MNYFLRQFPDPVTFQKYSKGNFSNTNMICKLSWIFHWNYLSPVREIPIQPVLDPWREVGRPKGLRVVKGDPNPWFVQVEGKRYGELG